MGETKISQSANIRGRLLAKAEGALIALAAGDALGWPQEFPKKIRGEREASQISTEFRAWTRRGGGRFYPHEEVIQAGEYSDDTQLTLAVARCRTVAGSGWWTALTRTELPLWTLYERGGGGATKRAVDAWVRGEAPWKGRVGDAVRKYFDAGGNGVAMRVLPHALFHAVKDDPTPLIRDVVMDGVATHGHPRALVGAATYAYAAWWLTRALHTVRFAEIVQVLVDGVSQWGSFPGSGDQKNGWFEAANRSFGDNYEVVWAQVVGEMKDLLGRVRQGLEAGAIADDNDVLRELGCFGETKGAGTVSTAAAVYLCARYAAQPVQGVLRAAFSKGSDTDTLAAMTGGLMGCLAGIEWLPQEWFNVQDCDYLRHLAAKLASCASGVEEQPARLRSISHKELEEIRRAIMGGNWEELDLDGVRYASVIDSPAQRSLTKSTAVHAWKLRVSDGQTLYTTKFSRKAKNETVTVVVERRPPEQLVITSLVQAKATAAGVKLSVKDLKAVAAFYENIVGVAPVKKTSRYISYGSLSLVDADYAEKLSSGFRSHVITPGRNCVEIHVSDLDGIFGRVRESGAHIANNITTMPWGERVFHCVDPEGNLVEIVERQRKKFQKD